MDSSVESMQHQLDRFSDWQRVNPIGILYFADKWIRALIGNIFVLIPAFIALRSSYNQNPELGSLILVGVIGLFIAFVITSYYMFQFRIHDGRIEIKKGIFKRLRLNVPFDKVLDIKLEEPIYYRSAKMTVVQLDTAGSFKQEAVLIALPQSDAEVLKQIMQSMLEAHESDTDSHFESAAQQQQDKDSDQLLITRSLKDLVIYGITNNRVWIILGALAPFIDDAITKLDGWLTLFNISEYYSLEHQGVLFFTTVLISTIMVFIILVTALSILGAIITFYGYSLYQSADRLKLQSGLLTRYQVNVKIARIQHIVYKQDWLDSLFGRMHLIFKQVNSQMSGAVSASRTLLVPSIFKTQGYELGKLAFEHKSPFALDFNPISKRFMVLNSALITLPAAIVVSIITIENDAWSGNYAHLLWLFVPILLQLLIILRWYRWGYYFDDTHLYVRHGLFGVDKSIYPLYKLQQSGHKQTLLMRRAGLTTAVLSFASSHAKVPFMPDDEATTLLNTAIYQAESSQQAWM